ncbi:hypothetical protein M0802_016092 [Mischocyttarus mexicanus]|nr:hypothetical protein M0802_016092 [Mischocyttarus mexicanus]
MVHVAQNVLSIEEEPWDDDKNYSQHYRRTNETNEKNYHHHNHHHQSTYDKTFLEEFDATTVKQDDHLQLDNDGDNNDSMNNSNRCDYCYKRFSINGMKKHLQKGCKKNPKNNSARYNCKYCSYTSVYKANVERHIRNIHDLGNRRIRCDLCNFSSNYTFCVRRHMRTFHPSK